MISPMIKPPDSAGPYILENLRIPQTLCKLTPRESGWCDAELLIAEGQVAQISGPGGLDVKNVGRVDVSGGIVLSGLVDCHTHLDKAHVAAFQDFPATDLAGAITAMALNRGTWTRENLTRRVEFSLKTAFANGVRAMRSHIDFWLDDPDFILEVLRSAARDWQGKIDLQLLPLAGIGQFGDPEFHRVIFEVASNEGRIGLFLYDQPDLVEKLTPIFEHAGSLGLDIDLHVDEGTDAHLDGLNCVADVVQETGFEGIVLCGHCVALSSYEPARRKRVIAKARAVGLHFVSLPVTNLFLQGRGSDGPPRLRGMAPVEELARAGALVSLGADNVRDGFSAFGDFDPMAVLNLGAQVAHLNEPARDWSALVTCNPARSMGLGWDGVIEAGVPADLVLFSARTSVEMSTRPSPERSVIRRGKWLADRVPDFRELVG